jgi:hypothetical protein
MTNDEYDRLIEAAYGYLHQQQEQTWLAFGIDSYERYDYDQDTGTLVFSSNGIVRVISDFQAVGSISTRSTTWLWAWANESIIPGVRQAAERVRRFGEAEQISEVIEPYWPANEADGWAMTALTAYLTQAKGGYRCPDENGFLYIVFTSINWAPSTDEGSIVAR